MIEFLLQEQHWFPMAAAIGTLAASAILWRNRESGWSGKIQITYGLTAFYAVLMGVMSLGHMLGVTHGTIQGSIPPTTNPWLLFPLGFAMAVPSWWLVASLAGVIGGDQTVRRRAIWLNALLAAVLLLPATPLAALGALNTILLTKLRSV